MRSLKILYRKHERQKLLFGINLLGLTIGVTFAILAFLYVQYEFKVDKHFTNTDNTYLLACNNGSDHTFHGGLPPIFMEEILRNVPEIKEGVRIRWTDQNLKINESRYNARGFIYVDSAFFNFMGWELLVGNPSNALSQPFTVVISEKMAKRFYKNTDPVGKQINLNNRFDLTITGVFKDIPEQSHITADFISSFKSLTESNTNNNIHDWGWHSTSIYLKTADNANIALVEGKIADVWNLKSEDKSCVGPHVRSKLTLFKDIYLNWGEVIGRLSNRFYVWAIIIIAGLILLISCLNFINLSITLNAKHKIENGVKKVLGAGSWHFIRQIVLEMAVYLVIALTLSYWLLSVSIPSLNQFFDKNLSLSLVYNWSLIFFIIILSIAITVVCSFLPIITMVRSNVSLLLKGNSQIITAIRSLKAQKTFRNALVVAQFSIGIMLITGSIIVNKQLDFIRKHDIGFDKDQVMVIENYEGNVAARYELLSESLKQHPGVKLVTSGSGIPFDGINNWGRACLASDPQIRMNGCGFMSVNENYLEVIGARIKEGRNFDDDLATENDKIIITEALARALNLKHPVGEKLGNLWSYSPFEIIGVAKDIEFNSIHTKNLPVVFFYKRQDVIGFLEKIVIKIETSKLPQALASINADWQKISPEYPLEYSFLDEKFNRNYQNEMRTSVLMNVMTLVAVLLCCMGLFGLALFHINARVKEIGIRKVNGARIYEVMQMLNSEFIEWIMIAYVVAVPISWFVLTQWLESFAYKVELSWWIFLLAGILALAIALLTVSFQSWRAATRNPVESLRYE